MGMGSLCHFRGIPGNGLSGYPHHTTACINLNRGVKTIMHEVKVHEVACGKRTRMSFSRIREVLGIPDLIEVQKKSYQQFLDVGLLEVLHDISPINDYTDTLSLELVDYRLEKEPKYTVEESARSATPPTRPRSRSRFV